MIVQSFWNILLKPIYTPLYKLVKGGTHASTKVGRSSHTNLKWAWNEKERKLLTPIPSNKNERKSTKNLKAMYFGFGCTHN
jgi:hypothetical protein